MQIRSNLDPILPIGQRKTVIFGIVGAVAGYVTMILFYGLHQIIMTMKYVRQIQIWENRKDRKWFCGIYRAAVLSCIYIKVMNRIPQKGVSWFNNMFGCNVSKIGCKLILIFICQKLIQRKFEVTGLMQNMLGRLARTYRSSFLIEQLFIVRQPGWND